MELAASQERLRIPVSKRDGTMKNHSVYCEADTTVGILIATFTHSLILSSHYV